MSSNLPVPEAHHGPHLAERFTGWVTRWVGSVYAFALACGVVLAWAVTGPLFGFSDTWQLVINTGTTVVTFLMVFLIQRSQNKDTLALHLKLNELIAAFRGASNRLIDAEDLPEDEVRRLHERYQQLAARILNETDQGRHHSVDEQNRQAGKTTPSKKANRKGEQPPEPR